MAGMGFRFHRSVRLLPGVRLNVSKSGLSASFGRRGAWFTVGPRGTRATVGIPGTGLSYTEQSPWSHPKPHTTASAPGIEVAELPREEIEVTPVPEQPVVLRDERVHEHPEDARDSRLVPIMLVILGLITAAALIWAALI
jgi:hypothetical protein